MTNSPFGIELTTQASRDLKRLRPWTKQSTRALLQLKSDPHNGHPLTGSLRGARSLEFSLKGGGAYQAVYVVLSDEHVCLILIIAAHESIYEKAGRRYNTLCRAGRI